MENLAERALSFDRKHARGVRALAYRMLGSRSDAEDIVQEAWLRWAEVDESSVEHPGAYLSRLAANLCLDKLSSAAAKREQYVGVWLPEPLVNEHADWSPDPEIQAQFAQDVSIAFMLMLERLSPLERAAFLLHDVFDLDFEEIGRYLERSPAACRQLASRARNHVRAGYTRREVAKEEADRLFSAFSEAVRNFDVDGLTKILTEDAVMLAEVGGQTSTAPRPLTGGALIAKTIIYFAGLPANRAWRVEPARINGMPGCLILDDAIGQLVGTVALAPAAASEPGRIKAIYIQRNPDKLQGVLAGAIEDKPLVRSEGEIRISGEGKRVTPAGVRPVRPQETSRSSTTKPANRHLSSSNSSLAPRLRVNTLPSQTVQPPGGLKTPGRT